MARRASFSKEAAVYYGQRTGDAYERPAKGHPQ